MTSFFCLLRETFQTLRKHAFPLFFLQFFDGISETAVFLLGEPTDGSARLYVAVVFPVIWLMNSLGTAATFSFFRQARNEGYSTAALALKNVSEKFWPLIQAEAIVGCAVLLGIFLILPGIYFLAIYLFVPFLVIERPRQAIFSYLAESQVLARRALWPLIALSVFLLLVGLGLEEVQSQATHLMGASTPWAAFPIRLFVSMVLNMGINVFICHCFVHLAENTPCSTKSPNASIK